MVDIDGPWKLLTRQEVMVDKYMLPGDDILNTFGVGRKLQIEGITKPYTWMDIGLYGMDEYYFFFCRFKPSTSYTLSGNSFSMWFQIGDQNSNW